MILLDLDLTGIPAILVVCNIQDELIYIPITRWVYHPKRKGQADIFVIFRIFLNIGTLYMSKFSKFYNWYEIKCTCLFYTIGVRW